MSAADMSPLCLRCRVHHFPDTRHYGRFRRRLHAARYRFRRGLYRLLRLR